MVSIVLQIGIEDGWVGRFEGAGDENAWPGSKQCRTYSAGQLEYAILTKSRCVSSPTSACAKVSSEL
jgi:hypothetical protein